VESFPPNGYGLYDTAGTAWQWCSDWYRVDAFTQLATQLASKNVCSDNGGPSESWDPEDPDAPKRVVKGGSFLAIHLTARATGPVLAGARRPILVRRTPDFAA
jgi:formylglycine-generating enzyme